MPIRIFVACAPEDNAERDLFAEHFATGRRRYEIADISAEGLCDERREASCRQLIRACNRVIVLVGKHTYTARGVRWQIECAGEEGKPTLGIHLSSYAKGRVPPELAGCQVIDWVWSDIDAFLIPLQ